MTRIQRLSVLTLLALVMGACSSDGGADTTTTADATTSTTLATTTTPPSTTTTAPPTTTTTEADPAADFAEHAPATWVGVTTDHEAVEVDTATGEVIRSLGQVSTAEDVENAECAACINSIDLVWRTFDGSHVIISECCEPAAGQIHVLDDSELPLRFDSEKAPVFFWTAAPAPDSSLIAFLGYGIAVADAADPGAVLAALELADFPVSNPAWVPGEESVRWLEDASGTLQIRTFDVTAGTSSAVEVPELEPQGITGLAIRPTGEMVAMSSGPDPDGETTGVVIRPDGEIVGEFSVEAGARPGGYDPSGTYLIYTDGDGRVHWRSADGTGVLAEGYHFASW